MADGDRRGENVGRDVDGRFGSSRSASLEKCGLFPQSCQSLTPQHLNYNIIIQNMYVHTIIRNFIRNRKYLHLAEIDPKQSQEFGHHYDLNPDYILSKLL